jgi:segregation and condensation protein A
VSSQVAVRQTESYQVSTELYDGPLDLLLELIEHAELDITQLALAQVTDQYLDYLRNLQEYKASEVSAFLVIAARLIQIKSAALLPKPVLEHVLTDEEDLGEALARQLILYKRFKELAAYLNQRQENGLRTFLRLASPPKMSINVKPDLSDITLDDLVMAARGIFFNQPLLTSLDRVVTMPRVTIREKIQSILENLRHIRHTTFRAMFTSTTSRGEIVVTFLALLELVKRHIVAAQQTSLFADIQIQPLEEIENRVDGIALDYDMDEDRIE